MPEEAVLETPPAETGEAKPSFLSVLSEEMPKEPGTQAAPDKEAAPVKTEAEAKPVPEPVPAKPDGRAPAELFKKADAAKADAPPTSEIDKIADSLKPKSEGERNNISALRTKAKEFEDKARSLEAKIAEADLRGKNTEALETRLKEIEAKNVELTETVSRANVEALPEFRQKYVDGRQKLVEQAQALVKDNGGDAAAIEVALHLKGKARIDALREVADELPGYQQGMLGQVLRELDVLDTEAGEKRSKANEYWKEVQQQQQRREEEEQKSLIKNVHESYEQARRRLSSELEVLKPIKTEGMEWWNEQASSIEKEAKEDFTEKWTVQRAAECAIKARACDVYRELFTKEREYSDTKIAELTKERDDAQTELKGIYEKSPQMVAGRSTAGAVKPKGFFEVLDENMPEGT